MLGDRARGELFDLLQQFGFGLGGIAVVGYHRDGGQQARVAHGLAIGTGGRGQLGFHQRLVQAPAGRVAQHVGQDAERRVVGVHQRGGVVGGRDQAQVADTAHGDLTLAVLGGFGGVEARQHARGLLQRAEVARHAGEHIGAVDTAGNHQGGVVRLVPLAVERLQLVDRYAFHITARTDGGVAVVVPQEGGGAEALEQHAGGIVLAGFQFVAYHGHLAVQVLPGHVRVDHAVGFHLQHPLQGVGVGREGGEVVGAVQAGGGVEVDAALLHFAADVRLRGRALEQQVLQQVGHAGLAVVLVHRTHAVDQVDGHGGLGGVGEQQHAQAVGQRVLADAFDAGAGGDAPGQRGGGIGPGRLAQGERHGQAECDNETG